MQDSGKASPNVEEEISARTPRKMSGAHSDVGETRLMTPDPDPGTTPSKPSKAMSHISSKKPLSSTNIGENKDLHL